MQIQEKMSLYEKLKILSDAAKYDVACTSSGVTRRGDGRGMGNCTAAGICHSFSGDGRCISLLKVLFTNECIYNCRYCVNRSDNDVPRASFTPQELCGLTMEFYRRNYIEGLFLSSGILKNPTYTMELIYETIRMLRQEHHFQGYIHVKAIPGADAGIVERLGYLADRMSVNLELPTAESLKRLAPNKTRSMILKPMRQIQNGVVNSREEMMLYRNAPRFVPAGQSTQMIIGATPETDYQIMSVAESLYQGFALKRVFYSAYVQVNEDRELPALLQGPPLLREHRLYQADWLLRFYGFRASELFSEDKPNLDIRLDPKCDWAIRNLGLFPVEVNRAEYAMLLRVPGIGVKSAMRILKARRHGTVDFPDLKKMGVALKRASWFLTCRGKTMHPLRLEEHFLTEHLAERGKRIPVSGDESGCRQMTLFDFPEFEACQQDVGVKPVYRGD
ncbi:MAG: putative DNA modification/repair radical SAM protein [Lachnospiraceae bacterium]|nr:putative DNA modification/repair radical SAM protein [Lachnospiraceae bacterium]MDD7024749.1 putative DNA modification/repair radical SAM protein [Oscillospiraceae bacterium]